MFETDTEDHYAADFALDGEVEFDEKGAGEDALELLAARVQAARFAGA